MNDETASAVDAGFVINPIGVEGQVEGGTIQALGQALTERMVFDDKGHLLNPSFLDYKLPLAPDIPEFDTIVVESLADQGAMGTKGVGEAPVVATASAIASAVSAATGATFDKLPLMPEYVLERIEAALSHRRLGLRRPPVRYRNPDHRGPLRPGGLPRHGPGVGPRGGIRRPQ